MKICRSGEIFSLTRWFARALSELPEAPDCDSSAMPKPPPNRMYVSISTSSKPELRRGACTVAGRATLKRRILPSLPFRSECCWGHRRHRRHPCALPPRRLGHWAHSKPILQDNVMILECVVANEKARVATASGLSICLVAGIGFEPMTFGL